MKINPDLAGIFALLMWSLAVPLIVNTGNIPPLQLGAMTLFGGFLVLSARHLLLREEYLILWRQPARVYAIGFLGIGVYISLLYCGLKFAPPFEAAVLNYTWPLLLVLLSLFLNAKKITPMIVVGMLMGFCGSSLVLLTRPAIMPFYESHYLAGLLCALSGSLVWAVYSVLTRRTSFSASAMTPIMFLSAFLIFLLHLIFETSVIPKGLGPWVTIALLSLTRTSYVLWDVAMKHGHVVRLASLSYFVPVVSISFLIALGYMPQNSLALWGGLLVLAGSLLVNAQDILAKLKRTV